MEEGERQLEVMRRDINDEVRHREEITLQNKQMGAQINVLHHNLQMLDNQINCLRGLMNSLSRIHTSVRYVPKESDYSMKSPLNRRKKNDEDEDEDDESSM